MKLIFYPICFLMLVGVVSAVDITECQEIDSPGHYNLINNLQTLNIYGSSCFNITSNDVYFNCNNNNISRMIDSDVDVGVAIGGEYFIWGIDNNCEESISHYMINLYIRSRYPG